MTLVEFYDKEWAFRLLDDVTLVKFQNYFEEYKHAEVDIVDFIMVFLKVLNSEKHHQIYQICGIIELFKDIISLEG